MKKIFWAFVLSALLLLAVPAHAVTLAWDDGNAAPTTGYTLYWQEDGNTGEVYNVSVTDKIVTIENELFKPNTAYRFIVKAYNTYYESLPSESITWTRVVAEYTPPADKLPTVAWPEPSINEPVVALTITP